MNFNRLWAVVNKDTNDVLYCSFDYNRAKSAYDKLIAPISDEAGQAFPNIGDLWKISFVRYDINPNYRDFDFHVSAFQKSLNDDFRAFMDFCLLRHRDKNNNQQQTTIK